jgi:NAD(P)-dependent dehydrogenase (short-subunit alcohol dehydrogenase family)
MTAAELFNLKGRVALVTGASSGLGVRFAEVLAREGAPVALVARRTDRLAALRTRIEAAGGRAIAIGADVLDRKAMTRAFDEAEKAFGTVTILVNNAGVAHSGRALSGGASSAPISTRCSSGRRRRHGGCWPPARAAPSSTLPPCSASASPRVRLLMR